MSTTTPGAGRRRAGRPERTAPAPTSSLVPTVEPLGVSTQTTPPQAPAQPPPSSGDTTPAPNSGTTEHSKSESSGVSESATSGLPESAVPKYLQFVRHDLRVREDQLGDLAALRRRIAGRRRPGQRHERITDNTLIRVAIDALLARADQLTGTTEDELRTAALRTLRPRPSKPMKSRTLEVPNSLSSEDQ